MKSTIRKQLIELIDSNEFCLKIHKDERHSYVLGKLSVYRHILELVNTANTLEDIKEYINSQIEVSTREGSKEGTNFSTGVIFGYEYCKSLLDKCPVTESAE